MVLTVQKEHFALLVIYFIFILFALLCFNSHLFTSTHFPFFCFVTDFTFSSDTCGGSGVGSGEVGEGGRGSSLDQDSLGGGVASEEHEVASLTTLHIDSENSSLSHTVTVTGMKLECCPVMQQTPTVKLQTERKKSLTNTHFMCLLISYVLSLVQVLRAPHQCTHWGVLVPRHLHPLR